MALCLGQNLANSKTIREGTAPMVCFGCNQRGLCFLEPLAHGEKFNRLLCEELATL